MKATPDIDQMLNITTHSRSKGTESDTLIIRAVPSVPSNARVEQPATAHSSVRTAQNIDRAGRAPSWIVTRAARTRC